MIKKILKDESGQLLPFIAVILVIMLLFSSFAIATSMSFRERKTVQDIVDAALLSAMLVSVEERQAPTRYTQTYNNSSPRSITCTDSEGNSYIVTVYTRRNYYVLTSNYANYMYINTSKAREIFETYLKLNLTSNTAGAKILDWNLTIKYDDDRYLNITKNLPDLHTSNYTTSHSRCGTSYTRTHDFSGVSNPSAWWISIFSGQLGIPGGWTNATSEEKRWRISGTHGLDGPVPFPRYVEVTATATVEVASPMGSMLGGSDKQVINVTAKSVTEISNLN